MLKTNSVEAKSVSQIKKNWNKNRGIFLQIFKDKSQVWEQALVIMSTLFPQE